MGLQFVRAYGLAKVGEKQKARLITLEARAQRPYSSDLALAGAILLNRVGEGDEAYRAVQDLARFDPLKIDLLYTSALKSGRYAEAIELFPQLSPPRDFPPSPGYNFQIVDTNLRNRARAEIFWANRAASTAIAAASLGRQQEAEAILKAARQRLQAALDAKPSLELYGKPVKAKYLPDLAKNLNALMEQRGLPALDRAEQEVARIANAPRISPVISQFSPLGEEDEELSALLARLPDVELKKRVLPYQKLDFKLFGGTDEGYSDVNGSVAGTKKIKTRSHVSTAGVVEEVALLRAAYLTREEGKSGFMVLDRTVIQHTMSTSTYGIQGPPGLDGFSVELTIKPVGAEPLPEEYKNAQWRIFDAAKVIEALDPVYARKDRTAQK